jgi:hypothetical protein
MDVPTKAAHLLTLALVTVVVWLLELVFRLKIQNSFNSIRPVFMEQDA